MDKDKDKDKDKDYVIGGRKEDHLVMGCVNACWMDGNSFMGMDLSLSLSVSLCVYGKSIRRRVEVAISTLPYLTLPYFTLSVSILLLLYSIIFYFIKHIHITIKLPFLITIMNHFSRFCISLFLNRLFSLFFFCFSFWVSFPFFFLSFCFWGFFFFG